MKLLFANFDSEVAEAHAEVLDQTIGLLRSMRHNLLQPRHKVFVDVLSVASRAFTPSTVATDSVTIES